MFLWTLLLPATPVAGGVSVEHCRLPLIVLLEITTDGVGGGPLLLCNWVLPPTVLPAVQLPRSPMISVPVLLCACRLPPIDEAHTVLVALTAPMLVICRLPVIVALVTARLPPDWACRLPPTLTP